MSKIFKLAEIINFAIEKEEDSYKLYEVLQDKVQDEEMKEFFQVLMDEETKHRDFYLDFLNKIEKKQTPIKGFNDEYDLYLQELIKSSRMKSVFCRDVEKSLETTLDFAIEREKESILFYNGLKYYVDEVDLKSVEFIIKEESKHIIKLLKIKRELL
jgi:rubrerythrin